MNIRRGIKFLIALMCVAPLKPYHVALENEGDTERVHIYEVCADNRIDAILKTYQFTVWTEEEWDNLPKISTEDLPIWPSFQRKNK